MTYSVWKSVHGTERYDSTSPPTLAIAQRPLVGRSPEGVDSELRWDIRNDSPTCELALPPAPLESADHKHETAGIRIKIDDQAGESIVCASRTQKPRVPF